MRQGKLFEKEFVWALSDFNKTHNDFFFWRIYDKAGVGPQVPADFMAVYKGVSYLFECKTSKNTSFNFSRLAPHQKESLVWHNNAGGKSYVVIQSTKDIRHKEAFAVPIRLWSLIQDNIGRQSIPWDYLRDNNEVINLQKKLIQYKLKGCYKKSIYDLTPMFSIRIPSN